jgi:Lipoxygenase
VREVVAKNWSNDEYYCHELMNGVNPFSVHLVDHINVKINQEFINLKDENNQPVVEQFSRGDLFVCKYAELRQFVYPNTNSDLKREVLVLEPEVLFGVRDGKFVLLGIGFYFGKDGTMFEVLSPSGYSWRGQYTPDNMWVLAKAHALAADSQTHEIIMHLGMAHLFTEPFAVAHHNTFKYKGNAKLRGCKHIGEMLEPHFVNLLAINALGRETLIAKVDD